MHLHKTIPLELSTCGVDCAQSLSFLLVIEILERARYAMTRETTARRMGKREEKSPSSPLSARLWLSLAPVPQLLWTRKERDCVQSTCGGILIALLNQLSWTPKIFEKSSTLSLPRVINLKFWCSITRNITPHWMKNLAFHSLLRWKMVTLPILTTSLTFLFKGLGERTGGTYCWTWEWKA